MLFFRALTPSIASLATFIFFEILYQWPSTLWWDGIILLGILGSTIWYLLGSNLTTPWSRGQFMITPVTLIATTYAFVLFTPRSSVYHIFALVPACIVFLYFYFLYHYIWRHDRYIPFSLEHIASYASVLLVFFLSGSLHAMQVFLAISRIPLLVLFAMVIVLLTSHMIWVNKFSMYETRHTLAVVTLILTELFMALLFLPIPFLTNAALMAIIGYEVWEYSRGILLNTLTGQRVMQRLIFGALMGVLLLTTTAWTL